MNRRRFSGVLLGAGTVVLSGLVVSGNSAFARSSAIGFAERTARTSTTSPTEEELMEHVVGSWQRSYECEDPVTFVTVVAVEFDKKRNANDAFDVMREGGVDSFEDFTIDDEGDYGDLTDQGYLYSGVSTTDATEVNVALLYVQQGTLVYAIVSAGVDDQVEMVGTYYEALFDEMREESDILLAEDEMPRGFVVTEDSSGTETPEDEPLEDVTPEPTEEDRPKKRR